jgi:multicomponent Na+:H+ antiporter subunit D
MILQNLAVLQVVVPLLSAPLCLLLRSPRPCWALAWIASAASLACAVGLMAQVSSGGAVVYVFGGWAAPWGIEYRVDALNALVLLLVSAISTVVLWTARLGIDKEIEAGRQSLFYTAWMLCLAGLLGIAVTNDAFNLFVFLEISSLSSYVLIAMGRDRRALTASFQYLVMGTIGATFILIGIGFLYMATGTLHMIDIANRLPLANPSRTVDSAFAFHTVGIGLKIAMFPLHLWLPNAYAYAPGSVSAFLAATATKVAVYVLIRFVFTIFGVEFSFEAMPLSLILTTLSVAAVLVASTVAVFQSNLKRMLAYSSVAQIGYMLLGIGMASAAGLSAAIVHLFNHALMKGALFLSVGCIVWKQGRILREGLAGIGRVMPWTCAAFVVSAVSLIGVPLTTGFVSKWMLVSAALEIGWWPIAVVVVVGSLLSVVYMWRVVEVFYRSRADLGGVDEAPASLLVPTWILALANLYFGVSTSYTVDIAETAALWLTGTPP